MTSQAWFINDFIIDIINDNNKYQWRLVLDKNNINIVVRTIDIDKNNINNRLGTIDIDNNNIKFNYFEIDIDKWYRCTKDALDIRELCCMWQ